MNSIAWGARVSPEFVGHVVGLCGRVCITDPSWLMAAIAFETGEAFSPSVRNAAGSGAVGLIQFMPSTAAALGTTIEALAKMTAVEQLAYVERYFSPWSGKISNLGDLYGAILWPGMIGKPDGWVVFDRANALHPKLYLQNRGLDFNADGLITRVEVTRRITLCLNRGLLAGNVYSEKEATLS